VLSAGVRDELMVQFIAAHQNRTNKAFHLVGIPTVVLAAAALGLAVAFSVLSGTWPAWGTVAALALPIGFSCQLIGHAIEGNRPEVFRDWRFIFIGLEWWTLLVRGRI
jgi:uncharacterized membrane protein YGL010W